MLQQLGRWYVILGTLVVISSVFLDPYSFFWDASDAVRLASWWQLLASLISVGLLCGLVITTWLDRPALMVRLATGETLLHVALNFALVVRDGFSRYQVGFGGLEVNRLIAHFGVLGLRITIIYAAVFILLSEHRKQA